MYSLADSVNGQRDLLVDGLLISLWADI